MGYEDVRLHGCDHPLKGIAGGLGSTDAEQLAIVAIHHGDAVADQTHDERARRRHFPVARGKPGGILAPQLGRDLAVGRAVLPQVHRAEYQVEPCQPISGEWPAARQRPRRPAEQAAVEAQQARNTRDEILVERDNGSERPARLRIAQPKPMLAGCIGDDDVASVDARFVGEQCAECARIDRSGSLESFRRGVQNDRDGGQLGTPDDRV